MDKIAKSTSYGIMISKKTEKTADIRVNNLSKITWKTNKSTHLRFLNLFTNLTQPHLPNIACLYKLVVGVVKARVRGVRGCAIHHVTVTCMRGKSPIRVWREWHHNCRWRCAGRSTSCGWRQRTGGRRGDVAGEWSSVRGSWALVLLVLEEKSRRDLKETAKI